MSAISTRIRAYVADPTVSNQYGEWGALRPDQRRQIRELCDICDMFEKTADESLKENERLRKAIEVQDIMLDQQDYKLKRAKAEAYKEFIEKANEIITEIYNKHIFGSNDLESDEKDAIINFSDDVTYRLNNLLKEFESKE